MAELEAESITARAYCADLVDTTSMAALVASIESDLGPIEVFEYAPITTAPLAPATDLDHAALDRMLALYVRTPVELVRLLLPRMREQGHGAILFGHGASAAFPQPGLSGPGPAMTALRNWLSSLHGEVAGDSVYVGTLTVTALITGSAGHAAFTSGALAFDVPDPAAIP